jgi:mercuric reductase
MSHSCCAIEKPLSGNVPSSAPTSYKEKNDENRESRNLNHLVIIGGGSAAHSAAIRVTKLVNCITIINEKLPQGGCCVNVGCVPSKFLLRAAERQFYQTSNVNHRDQFIEHINEKRNLVETLRKKKYVDILAGLTNVKYVQGLAHLEVDSQNNWQVHVNGQQIPSDACIIATGSETLIPDIPGLVDVPYLTHESLYELKERPESLAVIGGGYIALENAQMMSRFGSKVTILQRSAHILSSGAPALAVALEKELTEEGIDIVVNAHIQRISYSNSRFVLTVEDGIQKTSRSIECSHVLVAAGRKPNAEFIALQIARDQNGFIQTNEYLETNVPNIFAAGDVTGKRLYVYTAAYDGALAASNASTKPEFRFRRTYDPLPWVIFTDPQIAGVGLDEKQATAKGITIDVSTVYLKDVPRFIVAKETRGFLSLFRVQATKQIVGARAIGPEIGELMMMIGMSIEQGWTSKQLAHQFYPYLTMTEAVKLAALGFDTDINKLSCCGA